MPKSTGFLQYLKDRNPYILAHHPVHPVFTEHLWVFKGIYFCKGCTVTLGGILFGGILYWTTEWLKWFPDMEIGFIFLALVMPTLMTTLLNFPRWTKHIARFLLGILMTSALVMLFITHSLIVQLAIVFTFLVIRIPLERKRRRDNDELLKQQTQSLRK